MITSDPYVGKFGRKTEDPSRVAERVRCVSQFPPDSTNDLRYLPQAMDPEENKYSFTSMLKRILNEVRKP